MGLARRAYASRAMSLARNRYDADFAAKFILQTRQAARWPPLGAIDAHDHAIHASGQRLRKTPLSVATNKRDRLPAGEVACDFYRIRFLSDAQFDEGPITRIGQFHL